MKIFVAEIVINNVIHEFYFKRLKATNGKRYCVTVVDQNTQLYSFHMELQNGQWTIVDAPEVPQWIHNKLFDLRNAVLSNEGEINLYDNGFIR